MKPIPNGGNMSRKEDNEITRIKAILLAGGEEEVEETEEERAVRRIHEELFEIKPKESTLKDWMAKRKENNSLK